MQFLFRSKTFLPKAIRITLESGILKPPTLHTQFACWFTLAKSTTHLRLCNSCFSKHIVVSKPHVFHFTAANAVHKDSIDGFSKVDLKFSRIPGIYASLSKWYLTCKYLWLLL